MAFSNDAARHAGRRRRPLRLAFAVLAGLALSGCMKSVGDVTGSIGGALGARAPAASTPDALRAQADAQGRRYDANPGDRANALAYAASLRALDQRGQSVAVLQALAIRLPHDREVLSAYGKGLSETGQFQEAAAVLARAHSPDRPDWRILSAQGAVADQLGEHADAQGFYRAALQIAPGEPGVLANYGLSLALSRKLAEAERELRAAVAHPRAPARARQNLVLVLALGGRFAEAEELARRDMSPADAQASVASLRAMVAQPNDWTRLRAADRARAKPVAARGPVRPASAPALPLPDVAGEDG